MLVVERNPSHENMWVILSGGVAKDTITVVRVREDHDYWKGVYPTPVCKGSLRWHGSSPHLLDIGFFASAASKTSKYYNLYIRQCLWYARVVLAAMEMVFPHCSREGTTLFSNKFAIFGRYRVSHVELLVDLHTNYCQDLHSPTRCLAPAVPAMETRLHASRLVVSNILRGLVMSPVQREGYSILAGIRCLIRWIGWTAHFLVFG
ncbi:hypothetical protein EDD17DRAFT_1552662 [Pisolithus thermaeus]|nr:hypothetical protein EDD17DRAFT_1552662 [Pisolithus thermaeus]